MELELLSKKALKNEPVSSLKDVLSLYGVTELKIIARKLNLDVSEKSKEEIEKAIFDCLTTGDNYKNYIKKLRPQEVEFLNKAYKNGLKHGDIVQKDAKTYPSLAAAVLFLNQGKYTVLPVDEIKPVCESFFFSEEAKKHDTVNKINDLAVISVVYYGAFGIRDLMKLCSDVYKINVTYEEIVPILTKLSEENKEFFIKDGLIIHKELNKDGFELLNRIIDERKTKERLILNEELITLCDGIDYFAFTPQYESLEIAFGRLLKTKEEIDNILRDIHYFIMNIPDIPMLDKFFEGKGIKFRSYEEKIKIYGHISEIVYVSRLWTEYGNSLVEYEMKDLRKKDISELRKKPDVIKKIGRNDPCPCGSGKKYKNCCGRGSSDN